MLEKTTDLTAVSLFAGVGGFDLALERQGVKVVAAVEIDKNARGVLAHRFPDTQLFNDVTEVTGEQLISAGFIPERGIITGGFPCQDLSVAGKRAGLAGKRSGLFWQIARLIDELTPQYFILENVPGLLSSNGGGDFGAVLRALVERGYGVSYRVLDAQYFGVPQRRRRVFIVGSFGDTGAATSEILALTEGLSGHFEQSIAKGQGASTTSKRRTRSSSGEGTNPNDVVVGPLTATGMSRARGTETVESNHLALENPSVLAFSSGQSSGSYGLALDENVAPPLRACGGNNAMATIVVPDLDTGPVFFDSATHGDGARIAEKTIPTLTSRMGTGGNNTPLVAYANVIGIDQELNARENLMGTLQAGADSGTRMQAVAYSVREDAQSDTFSATELTAVNALQAHQPSAQSHHAQTFIVEPAIYPIQPVIGLDSELNAREELMGPLKIGGSGPAIYPIQDGREMDHKQNGLGVGSENDPAYTLLATGGQSVALAFEPGAMSRLPNRRLESVTQTLRAHAGDNQQAVLITDDPTAFPLDLRNATRDPEKLDAQNRQGVGVGGENDPSPTLTSASVHGVAVSYDGYNQRVEVETHRSLRTGRDSSDFVATLPADNVVSPTLTAYNMDSRSPQSEESQRIVGTVHAVTSTVRRLTPMECERLQGFDDGWTAFRIDEKKGLVPQADAPRYKQMGNAVAVPCVEWIVKRLVEVDRASA